MSVKGKSISYAMEKELVTRIYTTNDLYDIVSDAIMDYIHEQEAESKR